MISDQEESYVDPDNGIPGILGIHRVVGVIFDHNEREAHQRTIPRCGAVVEEGIQLYGA